MSRVSIIVPSYKAEDWIEQCLQSIYSQDYEQIQLVLIDDPEGTGAGAARNRGLERAVGEYVCFVDADDYLAPGAVSKLVTAIQGVDMAIGSFRKFGNFEQIVRHSNAMLSTEQIAAYAMSNLRDTRRHQMLSGCWAKLYRREFIKPFPAITTAEDMAFNFDYLSRCSKVRFISDVVYNNRKRAGSLTTTFDASNKPGLFGFLPALKYVRAFLSQVYAEDEIDEAIDNSKVYHSLLYFMRICEHEGKPMNEVFKRLYP